MEEKKGKNIQVKHNPSSSPTQNARNEGLPKVHEQQGSGEAKKKKSGPKNKKKKKSHQRMGARMDHREQNLALEEETDGGTDGGFHVQCHLGSSWIHTWLKSGKRVPIPRAGRQPWTCRGVVGVVESGGRRRWSREKEFNHQIQGRMGWGGPLWGKEGENRSESQALF